MFLFIQKVTFYGSKLWKKSTPKGTEVAIDGMSQKAVVHNDGMLLFGKDGKAVSIEEMCLGAFF